MSAEHLNKLEALRTVRDSLEPTSGLYGVMEEVIELYRDHFKWELQNNLHEEKQPIQEEVDYWSVLGENLIILEEITNSLQGYAHTSEGQDIQHINDRVLELHTLAGEMAQELVNDNG